jgi:hypothetical protein
MVSTAGESGGLFETIENDPNSDFKKHYMLVDKGRGKIFDDEFLTKQKEKDPAFFQREYLGTYGAGMGNVFLSEEIDKCVQKYTPTKINHAAEISMGVDVGFGSSRFGICIIQLEDSILKVMYAKEFERASYEEMINLIVRLRYQYRPVKIFIDAASPEFIKSVKAQMNESIDYERIMEQASRDKVDYSYRMRIVPLGFNEFGSELLGRFRHVVSKGWFSLSAIDHKELVTQMHQAKFNDKGNLDKTQTTSNSTYDCFDACRLALKEYVITGRR